MGFGGGYDAPEVEPIPEKQATKSLSAGATAAAQAQRDRQRRNRGLIASIIGIATARIDKGGSPTRALNASTYVTTGLFIVLTALATLIFRGFSWRIWGASTVGLLVGVIIGITTDYFTDDSKPIVQKVARASRSGSAFTVLSGVSYGFVSALPAMAMPNIA